MDLQLRGKCAIVCAASRGLGRATALSLAGAGAAVMICARSEPAAAFSFNPGRQFDAVAVTGAVAEIPARFREWLKPNGRLFVVRGLSPVQEAVRVVRTSERDFALESLFETDLDYLRGAEPVARFSL